MDTFFEQLIKIKLTDKVKAIIVGAILLDIIIVAAVTFFALMFLSPAFTFLIVVAVVYCSYKIISSLSVEFEYIFTNGDLDIDKILGREDRKRRYSVKCSEMEFFEPYTNPEKYEHMKFDRIAFPCSSPKAKGLYCFAFRDRTYGRCLVVIDMTDELRQASEDARPKQYGNLKK